MTLFGGDLADELAEIQRQQAEEFDDISPESIHCKYHETNATKSKFASKIEWESDTNDKEQNEEKNRAINVESFLNDENEYDNDNEMSNESENEETNDWNNEIETNENEIEYIDSRPQTKFRLSHKMPIRQKRGKNGKIIKNNGAPELENMNVRMPTKEKKSNNNNGKNENTNDKESPFLTQSMLRQNYQIDRSKKNDSFIGDKSAIHKMARNNLQFLNSLLLSYGTNDKETNEKINKKTLTQDRRKFGNRIRMSLGAQTPKKRSRNYKEFQSMMKNREKSFGNKKDFYRKRGLRVVDKLERKVDMAKYGRKKVWNAGRGKRNNKRKVGNYETAKTINEW